jgi:hypothetical protein
MSDAASSWVGHVHYGKTEAGVAVVPWSICTKVQVNPSFGVGTGTKCLLHQ